MEQIAIEMFYISAEAIRKKQWIVVTGWSPHWMFGRWNLHYLDDPKTTLNRSKRGCKNRLATHKGGEPFNGYPPWVM